MTAWRNRIVGHGEESPDQLLANPRNWRIHPKAQQDALAGALNEVGWVQDIIVNQRSGHVIDGHARVALAISREEASVPVVYVDLDEREEGIVLATLDPLSAMAGRDDGLFADLVGTLEVGDSALAEMLAGLVDGADERSEYTQIIASPIYEPSGPKPAVSDLFDDGFARKLIDEIAEVEVEQPLRQFLELAAMRHVKINFKAVANYYAHASAEMQQLFEASALVIIDSQQAIERGFMDLHQSVEASFMDDYDEK